MTSNLYRSSLAFCLTLALAGCVTAGRGSTPPPVGGDSATGGALIAEADRSLATGLSAAERRVQADAETRALDFAQPGAPVRWVGDSSATKGTVTAQAPFRVGTSTCRKFSHTVITATAETSGSATACRRGKDAWRLVS